MFDRIRRLWARAADVEAIGALSDHDLADLGLSRDQALNLVRLPDDVPGRVAAMGAIFGLTEEELTRDRGQWEELLMTCSSCREGAACRHFLDLGDRADPADAGFCPNAGTFAFEVRVPG
jgi:hypothetical protein